MIELRLQDRHFPVSANAFNDFSRKGLLGKARAEEIAYN